MIDYRAKLKILTEKQTAWFNDPNRTEEDRVKVFEEIRKVQSERDRRERD